MSQHARTHTWQNRTYGLNILFTPVHYPCVFLVPSGWQSHKHTLDTWTLVSQVPQLLTEHSKPPGSRSWHILFWVGDSPGPWDAEGGVRRVCPSPLQLSPSGAQQEGARWQLGDIPGPVSPGWHSCRAASSFPGWMHSQPFHPPWASLILYQQPLGTSDCAACQAGRRWDMLDMCSPSSIPRNTQQQGQGILECCSEGCLSLPLTSFISTAWFICRLSGVWVIGFLRYPDRKPEGTLSEDRSSRIHHPAEAAAHSATCSTHSFSQSTGTSLPQGSGVQGKREQRLWKMTGVRGTSTAKGLAAAAHHAAAPQQNPEEEPEGTQPILCNLRPGYPGTVPTPLWRAARPANCRAFPWHTGRSSALIHSFIH